MSGLTRTIKATPRYESILLRPNFSMVCYEAAEQEKKDRVMYSKTYKRKHCEECKFDNDCRRVGCAVDPKHPLFKAKRISPLVRSDV